MSEVKFSKLIACWAGDHYVIFKKSDAPKEAVIAELEEALLKLRKEFGLSEQISLQEQALKAICLTRDYVGDKLLPPIEGWEWYDAGIALAEAMPDSIWTKQFYLRIKNKNT